MKTYKYLGLILVSLFFVVACTEEDVDDPLKIDHVGGLLDVVSTNLSYIVGQNADYPVKFIALHGDKPIEKVEVYNTYATKDGEESNTVLLKTFNLTHPGNKELIEFTVNYQDLIQGIVFDGGPLSDDDGGLNISDGFTLTYKSYLADGETSTSRTTTQLKVATRYAGVYTVVTGDYWNSGSYLGSYAGGSVIIESVDATIYRHVGHAFWDDQEYFFTVDNETGHITILQTDLEGAPKTINTSPIMTCEGPYTFEMIPCVAEATPDDVNGADQLELTVGYYRGVGATREFYEKLVKNVN